MSKQDRIPTDRWKHFNHHHEIDLETQERVGINGQNFIADKQMIPLLVALNNLGLETRTHDYTDGNGFVSIILSENIEVSIRTIYERDSSRGCFDGEKELLISWKSKK